MTTRHLILGVSVGATEKEIRKAFREKAKRLHPDAVGSTPATKAAWKELNDAKDFLLANSGKSPLNTNKYEWNDWHVKPEPKKKFDETKKSAGHWPPLGFVTWEEFIIHSGRRYNFRKRYDKESQEYSWATHIMENLSGNFDERFNTENHSPYFEAYEAYVQARKEADYKEERRIIMERNIKEQAYKASPEYQAKQRARNEADRIERERQQKFRSDRNKEIERQYEYDKRVIDYSLSFAIIFLTMISIMLIMALASLSHI